MAVNNSTVGIDDEHTRKLMDIANGHTDGVAFGHGQNTLESDRRREEFQPGNLFKAKDLV